MPITRFSEFSLSELQTLKAGLGWIIGEFEGTDEDLTLEKQLEKEITEEIFKNDHE